MTATQIFKMELFKYFRDKSYLIATGILAVVNIFVTAYFIFTDATLFSSPNGYFFLMMLFFGVLTFFANIVFMFLYPFHLVSIDYKNNVMSMLVSSGVNRTQLFFAKIGAVFLWMIILTLILVFIPFLLLLFKANQVGGTQEFLTSFTEGMTLFGSQSIIDRLIRMFFSYINSLVLISTATIILKGSNLTIFLFIGLSMIQSIVTSFLSYFIFILDFSLTGILVLGNLITVVMTLVFILISLHFMKTQNL